MTAREALILIEAEHVGFDRSVAYQDGYYFCDLCEASTATPHRDHLQHENDCPIAVLWYSLSRIKVYVTAWRACSAARPARVLRGTLCGRIGVLRIPVTAKVGLLAMLLFS